MSERKKVFQQFLEQEKVDRVPVAFWHHFVSFPNHHMGIKDPEVLAAVYEGQKASYDALPNDVLKIMSDGFFGHPAMVKAPITTVDDIRGIEAVGAEDPWITEQVAYVKAMCDYAKGDVHTFYSVFSPLQYVRLKFEEYDEDFEKFCRLFFEDPEAMTAAAGRIAEDVLLLIDELFTKTSVDGIYYSVQGVQDERADRAFHDRYVKPLDLLIMERIRKYTDNIIIHICGYGHYTNHLEWYVDYPAKVYNWATETEKVTLAQGKAIFGGKAVLGGFDNNPESILYNGSEDEIKAYTRQILEEAGTTGICLGADCTVAETIDPERIRWIGEAAADFVR